MPSLPPATVPTRARRGGSGAGSIFTVGSLDATGTADGRREGRKIGRSRVAVSVFSGTVHNRLPRGAASSGETAIGLAAPPSDVVGAAEAGGPAASATASANSGYTLTTRRAAGRSVTAARGRGCRSL